MLSVKCLQFVSFLVSIIVVVGKRKVPTAGLSQGGCTNTSVFYFLVSISVLVAKGKVPTAGLSQGKHTNTLDWFPFLCLSVFQLEWERCQWLVSHKESTQTHWIGFACQERYVLVKAECDTGRIYGRSTKYERAFGCF